MRIVFLGTAGSLPTTKRNVCAVAVQVGPSVLLFDCGEGTQRQFMLSTASYMKVRSVFISHLHGDHFLGLPALIQSMNFSGREKDLSVYGPRGTVELVDSLLHLGYFEPNFVITAEDIGDGDSVKCGNVVVRAVATEHTVPSLGYVLEEDRRPGKFDPAKAKQLGVRPGPSFGRLQGGNSIVVGGKTVTPEMVMGPKRRGRKVAISGDTRPSSNFAYAAEGADVLVHEATVASGLISDAREYGHSTAAEAARLAVEAHAKKLYLYHLSSRYENTDELLAEAKPIFPETYVAEDLMEVEVTVPDRER
ncbi:MAG TPA: ribonuclease Z [Methanomassiliicoccales archaeon]|nr:ribonuclease Z [Methanomassiliicoccales archaeon]